MTDLNTYGYIRVMKSRCFVCGKDFPAKTRAKRYCSESCLTKVRYAKQLTKARRMQALCNEIKMETGCVDCGYRLHPSALQFDHVPMKGRKIKEVSKFTDPKKMREEMKKCEIRCANCHFIKTMERRMMKRALTWEEEQDIETLVARLVTFGTLNVS